MLSSASSGPKSPGTDIVWTPTSELQRGCGLARYLDWLHAYRQRRFADYQSLWTWSTTHIDEFWKSIDSFEGLGLAEGDRPALADPQMPGARWFPGSHINYAEQALRRSPSPDVPALICVSEDDEDAITWSELQRQVGAFAAHLRSVGVVKGDRVVGYLPNTAVAVVAFLACASLGAVWSVCSPEFGNKAVVNRFAQLRPKVLIGATSYRYAGKPRDRGKDLADILSGLNTVEHVVWVDAAQPLRTSLPIVSWSQATAGTHPLHFEELDFDHPLWVLFSSGTTGLPKGIVHGHGGIVLEHLKTLRLHNDVRAADRFFFVGSTSWMVWNLMVGALLIGATLVVMDGSPAHPDLSRIWRIADRHRVAILGLGAGLITTFQNDGQHPADYTNLEGLRSIIVTGSPLGPGGFSWVRDNVSPDVWLASCSGGTDICSAFVGGVPLLPVRSGRIQAPGLGVAVAAWDSHGHPVISEPGELVVTKPMPSMPLYFWADTDGTRYLDSYFRMYRGVWRHGDYIEFDADGSSVIHGRSDSTLNRQGVRMGSAEIYSAVEPLPEVVEALTVGAELGERYYVPLFVHLAPGADPARARAGIEAAIRAELSARHLPDDIIVMPGIPHNRIGKKLEIPIKRMLQGASLEQVVDPDSVDDLDLLRQYADYAHDISSAATVPRVGT